MYRLLNKRYIFINPDTLHLYFLYLKLKHNSECDFMSRFAHVQYMITYENMHMKMHILNTNVLTFIYISNTSCKTNVTKNLKM